MVADMVLDSVVEIPEVKVADVHFAPAGQLYVEAQLRGPTKTASMRRELQEALKHVLTEDRKATLGPAAPDQISLGVVTHYLDRLIPSDANMMMFLQPKPEGPPPDRLNNRASDLITNEFTSYEGEPNSIRMRY